MKSEEFTIREATGDDLPKIVTYFQRENYGLQHVDWIHWKFFDNPQGEGKFFYIQNSASEIVGTLGYMPQRLTGKKSDSVLTMQAVDLYISPAMRGKKLFPRIQEFAMNHFESPLIAFPNKRSEKITIDLGWKKYAPIEIWCFPLLFKNILVKKVFGFILDLHIVIWLRGRHKTIELREVEEFNSTCQENSKIPWTQRNQEFLNWRYLNNPTMEFKCFELYEGDENLGYCILKFDNGVAILYDFYFSRNIKGCLRKVIEFCRERQIIKVCMKGIKLKLWKLGFLRLVSKASLIGFRLPEKQYVLTLSDSDW